MHKFIPLLGITLFSLVLPGQTATEVQQAEIRQQVKGAAYFVPNLKSRQTGKRLVAQDGVVGFLQTQQGRVLFAADGAYLALPQKQEMQTPMGMVQDRVERSKPGGEGEKKTVDAAWVVLKLGLPQAAMKDRLGTPRFLEKTPTTLNFFTGPQSNWRRNVPTYQKLVYEEVWPQVDLVYEARKDGLTYQLVVKPGADLAALGMETGAESLVVQPDGRLKATHSDVSLVQEKPVAYQMLGGVRQAVAVKNSLNGTGEFGYQLGAFEKGEPVVIEQQLVWSSLLSGPGFGAEGTPLGIDVDQNGFAYVTGTTSQADFPVTVGFYDTGVYDHWDGYATKFDTQNGQMVYSVRLGGLSWDAARAIKVRPDGVAVVVGFTNSLNFPLTPNALSIQRGIFDGFCVGVAPDGTSLVFSTLLGGYRVDSIDAVDLDSENNIYLTGFTDSTGFSASYNFPTTPDSILPTPWSQGTHGFVTKLNPEASAILYSSFLGGANYTKGVDIRVDSQHNAIILGTTDGYLFPISPNALYPEIEGSQDLFLTKINSAGTGLVFSTFLASPYADARNDRTMALAIDHQDNIYVAGSLTTENFITTEGVFGPASEGRSKGFVLKLPPSGNALSYSTYVGAALVRDIAVDEMGQAVVLWETTMSGFPVVSGSYDPSFNGEIDVIVTKLNQDATDLIASTFLGGSGAEQFNFLALGPNAQIYVSGNTNSPDFVTTSGSFHASLLGESDQYLLKLSADASSLLYSTLYGGSGEDGGSAVVVDETDQVTVLGYTRLSQFPHSFGAFDEGHNGGRDLVVSQFSAAGDQLLFSTFIGGSEDETGLDMIRSANGDYLIAGKTLSSDFPTTLGSFQENFGGQEEGFVLRLAGDGSNLVWSGFLGGSGQDQVTSLVLDGMERVYVAGATSSANFPSYMGSFQPSLAGDKDAFVARITADGSGIDAATLLGGAEADINPAIALGSAGDVVIAGSTRSLDFPTTTGALNETALGGQDVFISGLSADLEDLTFSSFLGGTEDDEAKDLVISSAGELWVAGNTRSPLFPTTSGSFDESFNGVQDIFVAKLDSLATQLLASTLLGDEGSDNVEAIGLDLENNIHLVGSTASTAFPTTPGAFLDYSLSYTLYSSFITKLDAMAQNLLYSTYFSTNGLNKWTEAKDIWVNDDQTAFIVGTGYLGGVPTTPGAFIEESNGGEEIFVAKLKLCNTLSLTVPPSSFGPICPGEPAQLSVEVAGDAPSFQWYKDDQAIPGATQATYSLDAAQSEDTGTYHCQITNACTQIISENVLMLVHHPIAISNQPEDRLACLNQSGATFQVDVWVANHQMRPGYSYQWLRNGEPIPGANAFRLDLAVVEPNEFATYTCEISNGCFSAVTEPAVLGEREIPLVIRQPENQTGCVGSSVTLSTEVLFHGEVSYQWKRGSSIIPNATSATLTLENLTLADENSYTCEIRSECQTVTTQSVYVDVITLAGELNPAIQPLGLELPSFTFMPSCSQGPLTFSWELTPHVPFQAEGNSLTLLEAPATNMQVFCTVTDSLGETVMREATLLVSGNPLFRDFNQDGCNTLLDLLEAIPFWNQDYPNDPNGDQHLDIRDFLYINLSGTTCP